MQGQAVIHIWLLDIDRLLTDLPDHVRMEGKTCGGTLLSEYDLNLCPDGISVHVGV